VAASNHSDLSAGKLRSKQNEERHHVHTNETLPERRCNRSVARRADGMGCIMKNNTHDNQGSEDTMKTYSVLFAEDVPHYGVAQIEANDHAAALEAAKAYDLSQVTNHGEWGNSACRRIVHIEDAEGNIVIDGIALDDCFLRYGGDNERRLCDAAPELLEAAEDKDLDQAHDKLSELLEDEDAGNDHIRKAAIELCEALNSHHEKRKAAIAKARGDQP
jgi:hypothetical protein